MLGVTLLWTGIPSGGVNTLLVASGYLTDGPLGSYAEFDLKTKLFVKFQCKGFIHITNDRNNEILTLIERLSR